jgi:hypothetical protein
MCGRSCTVGAPPTASEVHSTSAQNSLLPCTTTQYTIAMFEDVDWANAHHMRDKHDVTNDQADEALRDPERLSSNPTTRAAAARVSASLATPGRSATF